MCTKGFYTRNAEHYFADTVDADLNFLYQPFFEHLPTTGLILDAGCGSGRDTRFFTLQGFKVMAFDSSPEMVELASTYTGQDVLLLSFNDIDFKNKFDGIWACASLIHVSKSKLPAALNKLAAALKPGGIFYASFKYGDDEAFRDGRHFSDFTETTFSVMLKTCPNLTLLTCWQTNDVRPGRRDEPWLNVLLQKESD